MSTTVPFPGHTAPAVGFEQPFEMLEACHDRVRRSLALLTRLTAHVDANGHDAVSRSAASDVLRYFDIAAPLHHEDEELHVFPALLAQGEPALAALVERLRADHLRMAAQWAELRHMLSAWAEGTAISAASEAERQRIADFGDLYASHLDAEEAQVYPAARARIDGAPLARMGAEMQSRRRR